MTQIQDPPSKNQDIPFQDLLTFERALTQPVTILIYWAGLAMIGMVGFAAVGVAVGVALRGAGFEVLLALPAFVFGALLVFVLALLWRGATEFYVAVFKIADELKAVRERLDVLIAQDATPSAAPVDEDDDDAAPMSQRRTSKS